MSQIAKETKDLATRARANKLLPEEFTGGPKCVCVCVSRLADEACILGFRWA